MKSVFWFLCVSILFYTGPSCALSSGTVSLAVVRPFFFGVITVNVLKENGLNMSMYYHAISKGWANMHLHNEASQ